MALNRFNALKDVADRLKAPLTKDNLDAALGHFESGALKKWKFNDFTYPPLEGPPLEGLDIYSAFVGAGADQQLKVLRDVIANNQDPSGVLKASPLVALLAAFIWKQGDWKKVGLVLDGFFGQVVGQNKDSDRVVLAAFGRHLKSNDKPLVDQHTVRAYQLLRVNTDWKACVSLSTFIDWKSKQSKVLFKKRRPYRKLGQGAYSNTVVQWELEGESYPTQPPDYEQWWGAFVIALPAGWTKEKLDRLLFCFGKAAKDI